MLRITVAARPGGSLNSLRCWGGCGTGTGPGAQPGARSVFFLRTHPWLADTQASLSLLCACALWILHPSKASAELQGFRLSLAQLFLGGTQQTTPCPLRALLCSAPLPVCQSPPSLFESGRVGEVQPDGHAQWTNHEKISTAPHSPPRPTVF